MYDRRTRATRLADRAAALARTEAFVALRAAEISAMGPVTGGNPETVLADLEASLSPILAAPTLLDTTRAQGPVITGTVEIGAPYAMELEYGTARMAARPFARSTLAEQELAIVSILAGPLRI